MSKKHQCDKCQNKSESEHDKTRPYATILMYGGDRKDKDLCKQCYELLNIKEA